MMANYGNVPPMPQPNYNNGLNNGGPQANQPTKPATDYSNWMGNQQLNFMPPQPEQRGITVSYMVQSRAEYASIYPPAGQTVAIFNFPDKELCLKAKDMYGIDLDMRTFSLSETTPLAQVQPNQNVQVAPAIHNDKSAEPQVTKAEFDELKESLNALIKELKG